MGKRRVRCVSSDFFFSKVFFVCLLERIHGLLKCTDRDVSYWLPFRLLDSLISASFDIKWNCCLY